MKIQPVLTTLPQCGVCRGKGTHVHSCPLAENAGICINCEIDPTHSKLLTLPRGAKCPNCGEYLY